MSSGGDCFAYYSFIPSWWLEQVCITNPTNLTYSPHQIQRPPALQDPVFLLHHVI